MKTSLDILAIIVSFGVIINFVVSYFVDVLLICTLLQSSHIEKTTQSK